MTPRFLRVIERVREAPDVVTLVLEVPPGHEARYRLRPGQFDMLYAFGVGEVPISVSGDTAESGRLVHTVRAVGPVSRAITELRVGEWLGVRGPFGNAWPLAAARGSDVLIVAGGIGLIPLRPVLHHVLRRRGDYGRVTLLYGARRQADILFADELAAWRTAGVDVRIALNEADAGWDGAVGFVTQFLPDLAVAADDTTALVCGPEIMIRACARAVAGLGIPSDRVHASMERNMKCALGTCGHCQLGPLILCRDGPVFTLERIDPLMSVREL